MANLDHSLIERLTGGKGGPQNRVLLKGAYILTMDDRIGDLVGDVLINGDSIEAVAPGISGPTGENAVVIDLTGHVLFPGLVDSHVHAWLGAIRGIAPEADFGTYMAITHRGIAKFMTPEDIAIGQRITVAQALNCGVTTIVDNSHNSRSAEHSDAAIEALQGTGIRAVHAVGSPQDGRSGHQLPEDLLRLRNQYGSTDQLVTLRMFDTLPTPESWKFAAENGFDLVAEMGPWIPNLDVLLATKLTSSGHTYNHCAGLTEEQWKIIAERGAAVNMVPRSDSQFGIGAFIPILQANRFGLQEGISCDNEVSYGYDIFAEMRTLVTIQRGLSGAAGSELRSYGPRDALRAATVGGSANAGLTDRIGTITPGKKADLVAVGLDHVATRPSGSLAGTVVNFAGANNVDLVFVNGVVKKWDGKLVGPDYAAVAAEAEASRESLLNECGISLDDIRFDRLTVREAHSDEIQAIVASVHH